MVALYLCLSATDPCIRTHITQGTIGLLDENMCFAWETTIGMSLKLDLLRKYCIIKNYKLMGPFLVQKRKCSKSEAINTAKVGTVTYAIYISRKSVTFHEVTYL
jgi:hypothetical protein